MLPEIKRSVTRMQGSERAQFALVLGYRPVDGDDFHIAEPTLEAQELLEIIESDPARALHCFAPFLEHNPRVIRTLDPASIREILLPVINSRQADVEGTDIPDDAPYTLELASALQSIVPLVSLSSVAAPFVAIGSGLVDVTRFVFRLPLLAWRGLFCVAAALGRAVIALVNAIGIATLVLGRLVLAPFIAIGKGLLALGRLLAKIPGFVASAIATVCRGIWNGARAVGRAVMVPVVALGNAVSAIARFVAKVPFFIAAALAVAGRAIASAARAVAQQVANAARWMARAMIVTLTRIAQGIAEGARAVAKAVAFAARGLAQSIARAARLVARGSFAAGRSVARSSATAAHSVAQSSAAAAHSVAQTSVAAAHSVAQSSTAAVHTVAHTSVAAAHSVGQTTATAAYSVAQGSAVAGRFTAKQAGTGVAWLRKAAAALAQFVHRAAIASGLMLRRIAIAFATGIQRGSVALRRGANAGANASRNAARAGSEVIVTSSKSAHVLGEKTAAAITAARTASTAFGMAAGTALFGATPESQIEQTKKPALWRASIDRVRSGLQIAARPLAVVSCGAVLVVLGVTILAPFVRGLQERQTTAVTVAAATPRPTTHVQRHRPRVHVAAPKRIAHAQIHRVKKAPVRVALVPHRIVTPRHKRTWKFDPGINPFTSNGRVAFNARPHRATHAPVPVAIPAKEPIFVSRARLIVTSYLASLMRGDASTALAHLGLSANAPVSNLSEGPVVQRAASFKIVHAALSNGGTAKIDVEINGPQGRFFGVYTVQANGPAAWITDHTVIPTSAAVAVHR